MYPVLRWARQPAAAQLCDTACVQGHARLRIGRLNDVVRAVVGLGRGGAGSWAPDLNAAGCIAGSQWKDRSARPFRKL